MMMVVLLPSTQLNPTQRSFTAAVSTEPDTSLDLHRYDTIPMSLTDLLTSLLCLFVWLVYLYIYMETYNRKAQGVLMHAREISSGP